MRPILTSVTRKLLYLFAFAIILAAVLVATSRLITPVINTHKTEIENWVSEQLGMPVKIGHAEISWYQYQPVINFSEVILFNAENKQPALQIKKILISFSIPQSLWERKLVATRIIISGADVRLHEGADGEISVKGFPTITGELSEPFQAETRLKDMIAWLSIQPRITLQDIEVHYDGINSQKRHVTIYSLSLKNDGSRHILLGKGILHQQQSTEVTAAIQWEGTTFNLANIEANIYIYATRLPLSQWLRGLSWQGWEIKSGIGSAKIWANWRSGEFKRIQSIFTLYQLGLYSQQDNVTQKINRVSGNIGWLKASNEYILAGEDILIDLPNHLWPVTDFYASLTFNNGAWQPKLVNIGYLDLNDVSSWIITFPSLVSPSILDAVKGLKPVGRLYNLALVFASAWTDWQKLSLTTNISQLKITEWKDYPGIENFSAAVKWDGQEGNASIQNHRAALEYSKIFSNKIALNEINGEIKWRFINDAEWLIETPQLNISNNDLTASVNGNLSITKDGMVTDLNSKFSVQRINQISRYLPLKLFDPDLNQWLKQAFLWGEVYSGTLRLQGALKNFPFDKGSGEFVVTTNLRNVDLKYAPDWPALKNMAGQVTFLGKKMFADINHAEFQGLALTNVHGEIPDLTAEKINLIVKKSGFNLDFSQALNIVRHTPLDTTIGKMFAGMELKGPIALTLGLNVPLANPDETKVDGQLQMNNATLNLVAWNLALNNLNGMVNFTEQSVKAEHIAGELFNKPFILNLTTIQKDKQEKFIRAILKNNLNISDIEKWLAISLKGVEGAADFETQIDFHEKEPMQMHLKSNLVGISLNLPENLEKEPDEIRNFSADVILPETPEIRLKLNYHHTASAALIFKKYQKTYKLNALDLSLGAEEATWPEHPGLTISASFKELNWEKIKSYISDAGDKNLIDLPLQSVNVTTENLMLAGIKITKAQIKAEPSNTYWDITIDSPDVVGNLLIPKQFNREEALNLEFKRLHLRTTEDEKNTVSEIKVNDLPAISFRTSSLRYNNIELGQVNFKATPSKNGMHVQTLQMFSPYFNLQATGDWFRDNTTKLRGTAQSQNVSELLNNFGFDARNFVASRGTLKFNLFWDDAPFLPTLASLNGNASLDIGKGRIVDIGQESEAKMDLGRMLSIFSLRRLSLDFRDVFQKGYSYDSIRGNFSFKNGDAFTNDLRLDGPVAQVSVDGRIGLKKKDFDIILSVTAHVASSIPVAATLLTMQPWVGVAALAFNTILAPQVSKATTIYYQVQGPWNNASWKPVNRQR